MKRKRPSVTVQFIPTGGRYQICWLRPASGAGFGAPWLGPFLCDLSSGKRVAFLERSFYCDWLKQKGISIGAENPVDHAYATGTLIESCSTYTAAWDETHMDGTAVVSTSSLKLGTVDSSGTQCDYLDVYGYNSSTVIAQIPNEQLPNAGAFIQETKQDGQLKRSSLFSNWRWLDIEYDLSNGDVSYMESIEVNKPTYDQELSTGTIVLGTKWQCLPYAGASVVEDDEQFAFFDVICVSPVYEMPLDDGSYINSRIALIRETILSHLSTLGSLASSDGVFFSAQQAIESLSACDVNGIEFVKDLQEIKSLLGPLIDVFLHAKRLKTWAGLILWWKYVIENGFRDIVGFADAIRKIKHCAKSINAYAAFMNSTRCVYGTFREPVENRIISAHARYNTRVVCRLEVPIEANIGGALTSMIEEMGLRLTFENVWDTVPASFIIDWFVNIGGLLSKVDYSAKCMKYLVREVVTSTHLEGETMPGVYIKKHRLSGSLKLDVYSRCVSCEMPPPVWKVDAPMAWLKHWWEGALILIGHGK